MANALYRLGHLAVERKWRFIVGWVVAVVAVAAASGTWGAELTQNPRIPGTDTQRAFDLIQDRFPERSGEDARIVFAAPGGETLRDRTNAAVVEEVASFIEGAPHVVGIEVFTRGGQGLFQVSDDGRIAFATVRYDSDHNEVGELAIESLYEARAIAMEGGITAELGGDIVEFNSSEIGGAAELIGLGVAVMVLLVAFGSVVAMGLPILTALLSLGVGLMLVGIVANFSDIPEFAPTMASMVGIGVGIDYALFVVTRYRENLDRGQRRSDAIARAIATAGQAVVFAGVTVVIAILGLMVVGLPFVSGLGQSTAVVVAVVVVASITFLPALLAAVGSGIDKLKIPTRRSLEPSETVAGRWAARVSRNPIPYLVGSFVILAVMAVPFFSIRLGQNDAGTLPPSSTIRQAYDLLAEGFGPGFNGPLITAVDLSNTDNRVATATEVAAAIGADEGIALSLLAEVNEAQDTAIVYSLPTTSPQDEATEVTLARLRHDVIPVVTEANGSRSYITGSTAAWIDIGDKIQERLPYFVGAVVVMSFLLLMVVFRSLLVPAKAALMNLLGIGASYGVLVAVFQWGWGKELVGLQETVPILHFLPMFMFAILFGLSMDYEVFLMSRIREDYLDNGGDNLRSVETGIATTARVITAAAIIMVSVFGSFAINDDVAVKMSGIGLAVAIFLDATLIRLVLVPATMAVAGKANWWFPERLDRWLPRLDIEGEGGLPAPVMRWDTHPSQGIDLDFHGDAGVFPVDPAVTLDRAVDGEAVDAPAVVGGR